MTVPPLAPALRNIAYFLGLILTLQALDYESSLYPMHDGVNRLTALTAQSFGSSVADGTWVVWFRSGGASGAGGSVEAAHEYALQLSAQILEEKGIHFGFVEQSQSPSTFTAQGIKTGSILVYRNGKKFPFLGYRSPDVLVRFLKKIDGPLIHQISDKPSKKDFDKIKTVKVIGFFDENSAAYPAFAAAADKHQPDIPFFVVHDPETASHVGISNISGSVAIIRKDDRVMAPVAQNPATAADISKALALDGRELFRHVTAEDVHSLLQSDPTVNRLFVFSRKSSAEAREFYKALQKAARSFVTRGDLEIRVIDPDELPMVIPFWEATFQIDINKPMIGKVNLADGWSTWLNAHQITKALDTAERQLAIENWINWWAYGLNPGEESIVPDESIKQGHQTKADEKKEDYVGKAIIAGAIFVAWKVLTFKSPGKK